MDSDTAEKSVMLPISWQLLYANNTDTSMIFLISSLGNPFGLWMQCTWIRSHNRTQIYILQVKIVCEQGKGLPSITVIGAEHANVQKLNYYWPYTGCMQSLNHGVEIHQATSYYASPQSMDLARSSLSLHFTHQWKRVLTKVHCSGYYSKRPCLSWLCSNPSSDCAKPRAQHWTVTSYSYTR